MSFVICNKSILIDSRDREICFGAECIRYRTKKQFEIAYQVIVMMSKFYDDVTMKFIEEWRKENEELVKKASEERRL
jgi:hypothetical protein